jgi:3-oxoacyl-(acyl-carrier-protein) synthase
MSEGKVAAVAHAVKNLGISPTDCDIVVLGVSTTKFNTLTSMHDCYIQEIKV